MNAETLRNSILQLAICGKLVEQCEEEGTAEDLYQQILEERDQLVKEGKIKKTKPLPTIQPDEIQFEIPSSWKLLRLGKVCFLENGFKSTDLELPYLEARVLRGLIEPEIKNEGIELFVGDHVILVDGENSGEVFTIEIRGYMGSTFKILNHSAGLCIDYLLIFIAQKKFLLREKKRGSAIPHLDKNIFANLLFPLPPLSEQQRIVEKVKELLPLVKEYGEANSRLESLKSVFPDEIKQSILQYAIQGKLLEQRKEEGTAEDLYQQILEEREILIKEGKIKKSKLLPPIQQEEIPFEIPSSWKWVRLRSISETKQWKTIPLSSINGGDYPVYGANGIIGYTNQFNHSESTLLLTCRGATCGSVNISEPNSYVNGNAFSFDHMSKMIKMKFLKFYFESVDLKNLNIITGSAQPQITKSKLDILLIPLPPISEQKRIVEKIEEFMQLVNELKGEVS